MTTSSNDSKTTSTSSITTEDSAKTPTDRQPASRPDLGTEWIQDAMETSRQMNRDEALRRKVADRLF